MGAARNVGVRQFIHHTHLGMALEDALQDSSPRKPSAVFHFAARDQLQALRLRDRILAPVGFEESNHDVDAALNQLVGIRQHLVGLQ